MGILLLFEWLLETRLSTTMNGSHFVTGDGKMAEAVVRTGYQFAAFLNLTNLNPLQDLDRTRFRSTSGSIQSIGLLRLLMAN